MILADRRGATDFLSAGETELLRGLRIGTCFPLSSMNRLIGILLAGSENDDGRLTKEEASFIPLILPQAGIALENALLLKEQRERLRRMSRADRLATIGELAAGAAHEIRNPLTAIRSSLQYLEGREKDETARKLLSAALVETSRINEILSALLAFSRPSDIIRERLDLRKILADSLDLVAYQASKEKIAVERDFSAPLPVLADEAQLKQLFLNLCLNAVEAMPSGGRLRIEGRPVEDRKILVSVSDTGDGIPEDCLDRIFDPFFTTKTNGTGLGLSICDHIVKAHDGDIEVKSKAGRGATIIVRFPLAPETDRP